MTNRKTVTVLFLILLFINPLFAKKKQITPDGFEWMANTSINIMDTYKYYSDLIDQKKPKFFIDARTLVMANRDIYIPTTIGDITINPFVIEAGIYWKWQFKDSLSLSILAVANHIDLIINREDNPELIAQDSLYADLDWPIGKTIIAFHPEFSKNLSITAGVLLNFKPLITTDSLDNPLFDMYYDDDEKAWETRERRVELFLDCIFYGYGIRTFYESKESSISLLQLNKKLDNKHYGEFEFGLNYYNYSKTVQTGFQYRNKNLIKNALLNFDFFWDVHKENQGSDLGYTRLDMTLNFPNDKYKGPIKAIKDLYFAFNMGISYSKTIFNEGLLGYSWKVSFENIWGVSLSFGGAYNDYKYLSRLPMKNERLVVLNLKFII